MVTFRQKKIITVRNIGEDLQKARRLAHLSLLAVEKKIGICSKYLEALENDDYQIIPGSIYARNFLRKYTEFLGLDWQVIGKRYEEELIKQGIKAGGVENRFGLTAKKFIILPRILKNIVIGLVVLAIIVYLCLQLWSLLRPPRFEVLYPADESVFSHRYIKILGQAGKEIELTLNGEQVPIDSDGFFLVDINLNKGLNVIKFEAKKRYGRSKTVYQRIIVE